jgi:hypothetical protein
VTSLTFHPHCDVTQNHILLDLFIYYFGDNLDEETGQFEENVEVRYFNEKDIKQKYSSIQNYVNNRKVID